MIRAALVCTLVYLGLAGCSSIVRASVDTQPRVDFDPAAFEHPDQIVRGEPRVFDPSCATEDPGGLDPDLFRHAPVIVQGFQPSSGTPRYDFRADALGAPRLDASGEQVIIDTDRPEVYTRVEHATVDGVDLKALVYAFWYPSHPVGSIEKGQVDGGVLRITLDASGEPSIFEFTQPCGCFHGVFVSTDLEKMARDQFKEVAPRRRYAVEPPITAENDWVVRDLVDVVPGARPVVYMSAGRHACEAIHYEKTATIESLFSARQAYTLRPYDALEHAVSESGEEASIFNDRGLVHGGRRWGEEFVLSDLDNPGWPRHLDHMLIHWDTARWTDPTVLETHLRLPAGLTSSEVVAVSAPTPPTIVAPEPSRDAPAREMVLFTNQYCTGCQQTKKHIRESSDIRDALTGWEYRVIDTANPEGARLAAEMRVTVVPVLVALDHGRELFRSETLETPQQIVRAINHERDS